MSEKNMELLSQIYNAMANIATKGEDTLIMADCLRAMSQILQDEQNATKTAAEVVE